MFQNLDRIKLVKIILIIVAVVGLGLLAYFIFFRQPAPTDQTTIDQETGGDRLPAGTVGRRPPGGGVPIDGEEQPTGETPGLLRPGETPTPPSEALAEIVNDTSVLTPSAGSGGVIAYYNSADCKFYELNSAGVKRAMAEVTYCGAKNIKWGPRNGSVIIEFPDGANVVYDFNERKQYTLPKEMTEFSFSPTGDRIAGKFMAPDPDDRWLVVINKDGTSLTGLEPMGSNDNKVDVEWAANNQVVALSRTGEPLGAFKQEVLLIGFNGENFKSFNIEGRGFEPKWSPDGQRVLYSVYSDSTGYRPNLWLVDSATDIVGRNKQSVSLNTWASKCTLTSNTAYCAVPNELPEGVSFAPELAQGIPDSIWRVDLNTGTTVLIARPEDSDGRGLTVNNLAVASDAKSVFFTDSSGRLRTVRVR